MTGTKDKHQLYVYAGFFLYSVTLGAIFPRLGDIQVKMGIGEGALGLALIGAAVGTQIALMFGGSLIERMGYRAVLIFGVPLLGLAEAVATMMPTPQMFFVCLLAAGLAVGALEIVLNLEADRAEHKIGRRIMNRSHAFWSFGFFAAGLLGAGAAQNNLDPTIHILLITAVATVLTVIVFRRFEQAPARVTSEGPTPKFVRPTAGILLIVAFTLSAMLLEGAQNDWSVIFMRNVFDTSPFLNGIAFATGAFTQAMVRFFADGFVDRHGPVKVARVLVAMLGVGTVIVVFSGNPYLTLVGFAMMGIGTSAVFPLAMSAAAQRTDRPAATNVASVAQLSFVTFLIAPPLLGIVAEHYGIRVSFGIGIPLVILSWFTLYTLAPTKDDETG